MRQQWRDLAYLHFDYDPDVVQRLLPPPLSVDTFDGRAWVGLVPFSMRRISFPPFPPVPWLGSFPEVNVRTYVVRDGRPGVWFFSLDVNRLLPAVAARASYRLPYCWGSASNTRLGSTLSSSVRRRWPTSGPLTSLEIEIGSPIAEPTAFEHFLTARWGLYSTWFGNRLVYAPVDHERWPLSTARLVSLDDGLIEAAGLPAPTGEPHCMFSDGVSVRVGLPRRVSSTPRR
ncbi:MAG: hypothetical protein RLY50_830 [Actinomycetota bacterium]|jgi:uncharacterized protein YqjF (DUF2071 family)